MAFEISMCTLPSELSGFFTQSARFSGEPFIKTFGSWDGWSRNKEPSDRYILPIPACLIFHLPKKLCLLPPHTKKSDSGLNYSENRIFGDDADSTGSLTARVACDPKQVEEVLGINVVLLFFSFFRPFRYACHVFHLQLETRHRGFVRQYAAWFLRRLRE